MSTKALTLLALVATGECHYEDPNTKAGCASDEQKVQITGVAGDLCSPACNATTGTCPTDVPAGVTATPTCALSGPQGKYCALTCDPGSKGTCGPKASCKAIQQSGICTFDDVPPPASSPHWVPVISPTFEANAAVISVAFEPTGKVGWAGAGDDQAGCKVIKSEDAGVTWHDVEPNKTKPSMNLFLASAAKDQTHAVVSGVISQTYTEDGTKFNSSTNAFFSPAQDAKLIPTGDFALITGGSGASNGVATSPDGKTWTEHGIGTNASAGFMARYGAFPSASVWYVTAGAFPESARTAAVDGVHQLPHQLSRHVRLDEAGASFNLSPRDEVADDSGYAAAVVKTTDGGKSFTTVYTLPNADVYPNGISCPTTEHCVAAFEGEKAVIMVTRDGGKTWKSTMNDTDKASSLVAVKMVSEKEGWVSGGHVSRENFEGRFWHTLDGGDTWTKEAIPDLYTISFDLISPSAGFAVALTLQSGIVLLKYRQPSAVHAYSFGL